MKDPFGKTKVVIRQLPPTLSQSDFFQQIDHFSGRYSWSCFRPGKSSHKNQRHGRAYINFNTPEDVFDFAEFFNGHVFVNEKGAQYKVIVEYAPSQRVPKPCAKKDGREGTIYKDPDYLEFLKVIAKPAEHLPSAEIQLERKEAEQAGIPKEAPIVTPLMEYVRQKRAAESGMQGSLIVGKVRRRGTASISKSGSVSTKRSSEKKKYMFKENPKRSGRKGKSFVVARREDQPASGKETLDIENVSGIEGSVSGIPLTIDSGKRKILLLKGKGREGSQTPEGTSQQQSATSNAGNAFVSSATKQNQRREASGRLIRSIILSNEARQSSSGSQQKKQNLSSDNGKRPSRSNSQSGLTDRGSNNEPNAAGSDGDAKRALDDRYMKDLHGLGVNDKAEKRTRNRDRPDHGVWAPRRSEAPHPNAQASPSASQSAEGSSRQYGRRGGGHNLKDDGTFIASETKSSRRGVAGHAIHHEQKQVWVQKSSSGS